MNSYRSRAIPDSLANRRCMDFADVLDRFSAILRYGRCVQLSEHMVGLSRDYEELYLDWREGGIGPYKIWENCSQTPSLHA